MHHGYKYPTEKSMNVSAYVQITTAEVSYMGRKNGDKLNMEYFPIVNHDRGA